MASATSDAGLHGDLLGSAIGRFDTAGSSAGAAGAAARSEGAGSADGRKPSEAAPDPQPETWGAYENDSTESNQDQVKWAKVEALAEAFRLEPDPNTKQRLLGQINELLVG